MEDVTGPRSGLSGASLASASPIDPAKLNEGWRRHFRAKAERKQLAVVLEVPSGETIAAVRMPLSYMLRSGLVPDRMSAMVQHQIDLIISNDPKMAQKKIIEEAEQNPVKAEQEWNEVIDFIWINSVVLPKFVADAEANPDHPTDPTFPVGSVDSMDKVFLYEWCQGVNETVQAFRESTAKALGTLADEYGLSLTPEQFLLPDQPGGFLASVPTRP